MKELFSWLVLFGEKDRFGTFFLTVGNDVIFAKKVQNNHEIFKVTGAKCLLITSDYDANLIVEKILKSNRSMVQS